MNNINNSKNVMGMAGILIDDDEDDIDINDLEKSVINGMPSKRKEDSIDLAKEYSKEIDLLSKRFNLGSSSNNDDINLNKTLDDDLGVDSIMNWASKDKDLDDDAGDIWTSSKPRDEQLISMTNEERKQGYVSKVMANMEKNDDDADFVQKEDEEDELARMMEQIDLLRGNLESEGVDLSRIPDINSNSSKKEAKAVLRILQIKNDRLRYCDFFEEIILSTAYGLEEVFNGDREIFGSKIDLTGYSDTVKVKLRRMRYDTSNFVSGIMQGYNINSGVRIILELLPSLFLYSRDRRLTSRDKLNSDESYKRAIQNLHQ
jgi:hypothetical protein